MDAIQLGIITLMKSAVMEQTFPLPVTFDMETAMAQIQRHHISSLAYDGALRCGVPKNTPAMQKLFHSYCRSVQISERQMAEVKRICAAFEASGVDYILLKGCIMKTLYPQPELRTMGDADILVRESQYSQAVRVVQELGFQTEENLASIKYHTAWDITGLHLELHRHLFPERCADFRRVLGDGWRCASAMDGHQHVMSAEDMFLFNFCHLAKHCQGGGIGCRHVLDLWMYLKATPHLNLDLIMPELEQLHLVDFFRNIMDLLHFWFEDGDGSEKLEVLTEYIFANGSWGTTDSYVAALFARAVMKKKHNISYKLTYSASLLFPSLAVLREKYPILRRAPWLLPGAWVVRIIQKTLFDWKTVRQCMHDVHSMDKERVDQRIDFMRYIGLETDS